MWRHAVTTSSLLKELNEQKSCTNIKADASIILMLYNSLQTHYQLQIWPRVNEKETNETKRHNHEKINYATNAQKNRTNNIIIVKFRKLNEEQEYFVTAI
jgi:hypothetical protein